MFHGVGGVCCRPDGELFDPELAQDLHKASTSVLLDYVSRLHAYEDIRSKRQREELQGAQSRKKVWNSTSPVFPGEETRKVDIALIDPALRVSTV
jgi:hypothetical protein